MINGETTIALRQFLASGVVEAQDIDAAHMLIKLSECGLLEQIEPDCDCNPFQTFIRDELVGGISIGPEEKSWPFDAWIQRREDDTQRYAYYIRFGHLEIVWNPPHVMKRWEAVYREAA